MTSSSKIAVVTGANTGLGFETSLGLASDGYKVVLACRSAEKAGGAISKIRRKVKTAELDFIALDLIDRVSIRQFVETFSERYEHLDLLVNNAGVMGPLRTITENGLEIQFDANHLGHFYLTALLCNHLDQSQETRIVNVSSLAAKFEGSDIFFDNLNFEGNYEEGPDFMGLPGMLAYAQSKLANILFTVELRDRFAAANKNIVAVSAHPGASNTDLSRNMSRTIRFLAPVLVLFMNISKPAEGAASLLHAALSSDVKPGDFIGPSGKQGLTGSPGLCDLPPQAHDKEIVKKLWELSEELLGIEFNI